MAENKEYITRQESMGTIQTSEDVVASISSSVALETEGVGGLLNANMADLVGGKKMTAKGVRVEMAEDGVVVNLFLMIRICGSDKFVIRSVHQIPDSFDLTGYVVYEFFWRDTCLFCFQLDLLAMLIGSGLEEYIVALLTFEAGDAVREYDLVGVSDVRLAGCVGNRRGDIIFRSDFFHCFHFSFQIKKLPYSALL